MSFRENTETGFVVVQKRNTGDQVPKLSKIVGEICLDPEQAQSLCDTANNECNAMPNNPYFVVAEIEVSFTKYL